MSRAPIHLPLATHPTKPPHDPNENLVLLQSLRQSREKWISSAFPKFSSTAKQSSKSSKSQNQNTAPNPPPHTLQSRGKCDLAIGPHIFYDTMFYEVHYIRMTPTGTPIPYYPSAYATSMPNLVTMITPEIVSQVNLAASTNPTLANLLQLAAGGKASPDQLKTLGLTIQSLATSNPVYPFPGSTPAAASAAPIQASTSTAVTEATSETTSTTASASSPALTDEPSFDIVFEFRENNTERWLLPRGISSVSVSHENPTTLTVTALLPYSKSTGTSSTEPSDDTEERLVELQLANTPITIHDSLRRWAGGEAQMNKNNIALEDRKASARDTYLSYDLPEDPGLLAQLQAATAPPYTLKSIKPTTTAPRRAAPRRKTAKEKESVIPPIVAPPPGPVPSVTDAPPSQPLTQPSPAPISATSAPHPPSSTSSGSKAVQIPPSPISTPNAPTPIASGSAVTFSIAPNSPLNPTMFAPSTTTFIHQNPKKPRQPRQPRQPKKAKVKSPPPVIRCLSCGQTDVPLLLGGRFCRPCVEGGRANPDIPQAPLMRSTQQSMPPYVPVVQAKPSPLLNTASTGSSNVIAGNTMNPHAGTSSSAGSELATQTGPSVNSVGTAMLNDVDMAGAGTGGGDNDTKT